MSFLPLFSQNKASISKQWDIEAFAIKKKPSAVLVLFVVDSQNPHATPSVVLIRRSSKVGTHRGQIGFPGGRYETKDINPSATACREAFEEIGVNPDQIQIWAELPSIKSIDGSEVFPIIGSIELSLFKLNINHVEVQDLHLVPWTNFKEDKCEQFRFNMFGCWRSSYLYDCDTFKVWGLSAQILNQAGFKEV